MNAYLNVNGLLNISLTELAAADLSELRFVPTRTTPPTLRPHAGRQVTHRMVKAMSPIDGVTCGAKGARLRYTAHEGSVDCLKCLAIGRA